MIADLKADSSRWDDERRATSSRGQPANGIRDSNGDFRKSNTPTVGYRESTTHQSRQYYGPTETVPIPSGSAYPPPSAGGGVSQQEVYPQGYGSGQNYPPPNQGYGAPSPGYGAPHQPDNYSFTAGAHYANQQPQGEPDLRGGRGGPLPAQSVPRGQAGYPQQPPAPYPEGRGNVGPYYAPPGPQAQAPSQYAPHPGDPYYRQSTYMDEYHFPSLFT
jgi:hypothetical protein